MKKYYMIDIFKYLFCLGIVILHSNILQYCGNCQYWIEKCLIRLGVPFFFMVSGFLLEGKLQKIGYTVENMKKVFWAWTQRLLKPLIVFETLSLVLISIQYYLQGISIIKILFLAIRSIVFYPVGATWYLQASIVGVWIIYFFYRKEIKKWIYPIGFLLYGFALLCNSYNYMIENTLGGVFISVLIRIISSARNGVFYGFFFLALGMLAYRTKERFVDGNMERTYLWLFSGISYFLYVCEIYMLQDVKMMDDGSLFIILPIFIFIFLITVSCYTTDKSFSVTLRHLSTGIYLLHRPILTIFGILDELCFSNRIPYYLPVILTLILAHLICLYSHKRKTRIAQILM